MAIGVDVIKTTGRLVFDLERGGEKTVRTIDVPYPIVSTEIAQTAINTINADFTSSANYANVIVQPANWRDTNLSEEQWTTTKVSYELVTTTTTPVTPETPDTLSSGQQAEQSEYQG